MTEKYYVVNEQQGTVWERDTLDEALDDAASDIDSDTDEDSIFILKGVKLKVRVETSVSVVEDTKEEPAVAAA